VVVVVVVVIIITSLSMVEQIGQHRIISWR